MAYIPGLPGPRQHPFHSHSHPAGAPARSTPAAPRPPEVIQQPQDDDDDAAEVPILRFEQNSGANPGASGPSSGSSKINNPFQKVGFMANFRQLGAAAQELSEGGVSRYSKPSPRKDGGKSPKDAAPEETEQLIAIEEDPPGRESFRGGGQQAENEAPPEPEPEPQEEDSPEVPHSEIEDEVLRFFLQAISFPYKTLLAEKLGIVPRPLLERCIRAGVQVELAPSQQSSSGYSTVNRQLTFHPQDLDTDYSVYQHFAQAVDHTVGGDGLASRRALAVLAALPGPGWKAEDFFAQEMARHLMGQRGGPLESYLSYLLEAQ